MFLASPFMFFISKESYTYSCPCASVSDTMTAVRALLTPTLWHILQEFSKKKGVKFMQPLFDSRFSQQEKPSQMRTFLTMRRRKIEQALNIKPAHKHLGDVTRYIKLKRELLRVEVLPVYM